MSFSGSCLCGAVKFTAESAETHVHSCHCTTCVKWNGAPGMASSVQGATFTGEDNIGIYASSEWAERGFCKTCGSNLFYRMRDGSQLIIGLGSFDNQSQFSLAGEIYVDEKAAAYRLRG